jgi:alkylhydroperoxidase/carboxymuconolactone decarboxylase family protein YurZ
MPAATLRARAAGGARVRAGGFDESAAPALASGELAAVSAKFAEGYARIREVTDRDGACAAWAKALFMAAAAAPRGQRELTARELARARAGGLSLAQAEGAALALLLSRGEAAHATFSDALRACYGATARRARPERPAFEVTRDSARAYFERALGRVPAYVELLGDGAPRALEGYVLMREWALAENALPAKQVELMLCAINAADQAARYVALHAAGARRAGASEAEIVEAVLCAVPVAGLPAWLACAEAIAEGRNA